MRIAMRAGAWTGVFALAGWFLAIAPTPARADVPSEKALPTNTIAYLKIENAAKVRAAFKNTNLGQLLEDPALKPLKDDFKSRLDEPNKHLQTAVGVTIGELLALPQGTVSIAVTTRDDPKMPVAVLISADAGSNAEKMADVMAKATKAAEEHAKVTSETFKDVTITTIQPADANAKAPMLWTKKGTVFHVASDADALKDLLSHADGRTDSLASSENFAGVRKGLDSAAQAYLYLDLAQILRIGIQAAANQGGGDAEQITAQLQLLGLNNLKGAGASATFNSGEYDQVYKLFVYSPGPAEGVLKLFHMPAVDLKPQAWVPATVASFQSLSWDLDGMWVALNELLDMFQAGLLENAQKSLPGEFDFKKDLIGPIGNRLTFLSDFKKPISEKSQRMIFAVTLDDAKAATTTLNKILDMTKASPKKREFQGTTIYDFEVPEIPNVGAGGAPQISGPISVAIAKDHLMISTEPSLLEQILRGGGASLADSPEYQLVAKNMPAKSSLLSFDRPEEQMRLLYDMIKNGQLHQAIQEAAKNAGGEVNADNPIDPAKVPDFEVFKKYLAQGGGYAIMSEDGVTFTQFVLKRSKP